MAYNKKYQEFLCCPQCGKHLMNSDIILVPDLSTEIIACEDCWTAKQCETNNPMSVRELVEQGYYSYVDHQIDDMKESW